MRKSKPHLEEFLPFGYQAEVLNLLNSYDYSVNTPEIMLSGAYGSAKSTLLAHITSVHCLSWPGARIAIGRRSMPDLRRTIYSEIIEHLFHIDNRLYRGYRQTGEIRFANGSEVISASWGDGLYDKFRSYKLSGLIIEELTENGPEFMRGYKVLKARVRRIPHIKQNFVICATNPDEPDSVWYEYFIEGSLKYPSRHVFYSRTLDNIYLDPIYHAQLLQDYSPLEAERYLEGKWISIGGLGIYHAYQDRNFRKERYEPDKTLPLRIAFDFNTAEGKPQSCAVLQYTRDKSFHVFAESIIDNAAWCLDNLDDLEARGVFEGFTQFIVHGDASGRARSSNSLLSNYQLIEQWFKQRNMNVSLDMPRMNPPIVKRWNTVNAMCLNAKGETRLFVYEACPVLNQGLKLVRKKEGTCLEDDSKRYQHVTTALGYAICFCYEYADRHSKVIKL